MWIIFLLWRSLTTIHSYISVHLKLTWTNSEFSCPPHLWKGHCVDWHGPCQLSALRFGRQCRWLQPGTVTPLLRSLIGTGVAMVSFLIPQSPQGLDVWARFLIGVVIHHIIQLTCVSLRITAMCYCSFSKSLGLNNWNKMLVQKNRHWRNRNYIKVEDTIWGRIGLGFQYS